MLKKQLAAWLGDRERSRRNRRDRAMSRFFSPETLDQRIVPAVTAKFSAAGVLTIMGDNKDNQITVSSNAAGKLQISNGHGAVKIMGRQAKVAKATLIQVLGKGGNDNISLDETRRSLPRANVFGGDGDDTINGGSGIDQLFGQAGNDSLSGKTGADLLSGGDGDDTLIGGGGGDQVFGGAGHDPAVLEPGRDNDGQEGGG